MVPAQRPSVPHAWRLRNAQALRKVSKELNVLSSVVTGVLDGKRTVTQQVERRLADLGCPGFEQYNYKTEGK